MRREFLIPTLFVVAVSSLWFTNNAWKCETFAWDTAPVQYATSHPPIVAATDTPHPNDVNEHSHPNATKGISIGREPSFLQWPASPVEVPKDWSYQTPKYCNPDKQFNSSSAANRDNKIIVHFHLQHNAGTNFYYFARTQFVDECATRACHQESKHCMVSFNEEVEAENLRSNYEKYGVQYVSYELMLPPRFPLPFISKTARHGLYFTTIVRDPFKRFLTNIRRAEGKFRGVEDKPGSPFWQDLSGRQNIYHGDNLNARWLSGAVDAIGIDHINIAKCRLQLFDLVISDVLYDHATKKVLCPLNNWEEGRFCKDENEQQKHAQKIDPLEETNPILIGAWIERLRPSFEIYDYARILSLKQLKEHGVQDLPELSSVPSYMETLARYTNMSLSDAHFKKIPRVSLENEDRFHPPKEFCDQMKLVWTSNPDEVPNAYGIGTIKNRF